MQKANLGLQVSFYTPLEAYDPCLASSVGLCVSLSVPCTSSWALSFCVFCFCYINDVLSHIYLGPGPVKMCLIFKYSCKNSYQVLTTSRRNWPLLQPYWLHELVCFWHTSVLDGIVMIFVKKKKQNSQLSWYLYQSLRGSCHNLSDIR